jgi:hypothetical protein
MGGVVMIIKKMKSTNKEDRKMTRLFKLAVKQEIEKKKALGIPVARYDAKNGKAYLEYADGRREYVE